MTDERAAPLPDELKIALRDPLSEIDTKNNNAFDIQSQFSFGTVLAYSALHPAVPARDIFASGGGIAPRMTPNTALLVRR